MGSFFVIMRMVQSSNNLIFKNNRLIIQVKITNNTHSLQLTNSGFRNVKKRIQTKGALC